MHSDFHDDLLQSYSEAELAHHITASPRLAPISSVFLLSATLLAKHYEPPLVEDTVKAMEVARQLGIRAPCIRRIIAYQGNAYCVMERIHGSTLEDAWTKLGWFRTVQLALQLRRFIRLLRSVTSSTAGSLATGDCRSFWLEDRYGLPARSSPGDLTSFIQFWVGFTSMRKAMEAAAHVSVDPKRRRPLIPETFVFTHHDLAPRNILLASSGQLWLLDWDYAGFYPVPFEYASMQNFDMPQDWDLFARLRWYLFTWITVGRYEQHAHVLRQIRSKFTRFAAGRRFELLKNGGPSRHPAS
jgi:Phosphotransferase enzyme family